MKQSKDSKWSMTFLGGFSVVLIAFLFLSLVFFVSSMKMSLLIAGAAGIIFGISVRLSFAEDYRIVLPVISGFLTVLSTFLVFLSLIFVLPSFGSVANVLTGQQGIFSYLISFLGVFMLVFGFFLVFCSFFLVFWDKIGSKTSLGSGQREFIFTVVLGAITSFSLFFGVFPGKISLFYILSIVLEFLLSSNHGNFISGSLIFLGYWVIGDAWEALSLGGFFSKSKRLSYDNFRKFERIFRWIFIPLLSISVILQSYSRSLPSELLDLLVHPTLRIVFISIICISTLCILVIKCLKLFTVYRQEFSNVLVYIVFGVISVLVAYYSSDYFMDLVLHLSEPVSRQLRGFSNSFGSVSLVLMLMTFCSIVSVNFKFVLRVLNKFGLVPKGIGGTTILSIGIFGSATGIFLFNQSNILLLTGVAISIIIWRIGRHSVVLGREIGREQVSIQAEASSIFFEIIIGFISLSTAILVLEVVQEASGLFIVENFVSFFFVLLSIVLVLLFFVVDR